MPPLVLSFIICVLRQATQVDTGFTIIEFISTAEFVRLAGPNMQLSPEAVFVPPTASPFDDPRYGKVFIVLNTQKTLQYYAPRLQELEKFAQTEGEIVQTMLINDFYLSYLPKEKAELVRSLVLVDSKGIEQNAAHHIQVGPNGSSRLVQEAAMRAVVKRMSAFSLFMVPANEIGTCQMQLCDFSMSACIASDRSVTVSVAAERLNEAVKTSPPEASQGGLLNTAKAFWSFFSPYVTSFTGVIGKAADAAVTAFLGPGQSADNKTAAEPAAAKAPVANSQWRDMRFVFTKMDLLDWNDGMMKAFWFDVGRTFGQALQTIETPPVSSLCCIGLPEQQVNRRGGPIVTGDLEQLLSTLKNNSALNPWQVNLDHQIIETCNKMQAVIPSKASVISVLRKNSDLEIIAEMKRRAQHRLDSRDTVVVDPVDVTLH